MSPRCPACGHRWYERGVRLRDAADLSALIDERLAAFDDASEDVRLFLARARNARPRGMSATLAIKTLEALHTLHRENAPKPIDESKLPADLREQLERVKESARTRREQREEREREVWGEPCARRQPSGRGR